MARQRLVPLLLLLFAASLGALVIGRPTWTGASLSSSASARYAYDLALKDAPGASSTAARGPAPGPTESARPTTITVASPSSVASGVGAEAEAADLSLQAAHASEEAASSAETEGVADAAGGGSGGPSFITNSNGETIPVPEGASGLTPVDSGKGFQFSGGSGGNGLDSRVTGVRVMDPVTGGKYPYPNGYISYMNAEGQTVNPWTGQTVSNADPWAHWPWNP